MADVKMPESIPCKFDAKGWTPCKKPSTNGWCSEHEGMKCVSCGSQATKSCDAQMGGLGCRSPLCDTCGHIDGRHATEEVCKKFWKEEQRLREEGIESDRMLTERGVPLGLGLPKHLKELLASEKKSEYRLAEIFSLELEHRLMGYFPAIFTEPKKRIIITTDVSLIIRVWQSLEPRKSQMNCGTAWVNDKLKICYPVLGQDTYHLEQSVPHRFLTEEEHIGLARGGETSYRWAFGLLGASSTSEEFTLQIQRVAKERGVSVL